MEEEKKLTRKEKKELKKEAKKLKEGASNLVAEFKKFIARGNVVDLAVGLIIGSAFTKIVQSLTNDIIMPFIGALLGGQDFKSLRIPLWNATPVIDETVTTATVFKLDEYGQVLYSSAIYYGRLIQNIIDFLLVALVLFIMLKVFNYTKDKKEQIEKKLKENANKIINKEEVKEGE